ncbi:MAG TPA: MBL fold metallo-hydrolase [Bryobacteraceae bacterium]|nr:MBL fold metallo-hydrolase [Bryobacteraceae bacterium]
MSSLIRAIEETEADSPVLWWLGHCGFAVKFQDIVFYIDPCLSTPSGRTRRHASPLVPQEIGNADLILCTHAHPSHMDPGTVPAILKASPRAKVVLPKSTAEFACSLGIPLDRMTTTDSDLRVEFFKNGPYGRVYSVPSAHPELDWTPLGGYPHLGYLIRFGNCTIYHAGDCHMYEGIVGRLRPYNVTVALLPIAGEGNFDVAQAAQLAEDVRARWLVPMHYGTFADQTPDANRFVDHMLGFHPSVGFKVFEPGEGWAIP